jgi:hypothetical protein
MFEPIRMLLVLAQGISICKLDANTSAEASIAKTDFIGSSALDYMILTMCHSISVSYPIMQCSQPNDCQMLTGFADNASEISASTKFYIWFASRGLNRLLYSWGDLILYDRRSCGDDSRPDDVLRYLTSTSLTPVVA